MRKRKWNVRPSTLFAVAVVVSGGYWLLSGACTTPGGGGGGGGGANTEEPAGNENVSDDSNANGNENVPDDTNANEPDDTNANGTGGQGLVVSEAACAAVDVAGNDFETHVEATSEGGREFTYTRRVIANPHLGSGAGLVIETEVTADGELVMLVTTTIDSSGDVAVDVEYGAPIPGAASANVVVEDGMLSGEIDGRGIVPMDVDEADADATSFQDGELPPEHGADPDLVAALEELFEVAADTAEECEGAIEEMAFASPMIPPQDSGHDSDPETSGGCVGCWAGCSAGAAVCIGGVSAGCAASLIFYAVCEAIGVGSCAVAYAVCVGGCNATGAPCCPVACGEVACCESDETCLNSDIGLCCSPGKTPCVGESCCSSTETCIDTGPNAGICCQPEDICGNTCCDPTDSCIEAVNLCCPSGEETCNTLCCPVGEECLGNGLCCEPENSCGTACCDELDSCIESLSLCCGFNEPACNDQCCESGEQCLNGTTCCPVNLVCGSVCCPDGSSCDSTTNTCVACPNPTDTPCTVGGCCPAGLNCTDAEGICCPQGQTACTPSSTECVPISECIS